MNDKPHNASIQQKIMRHLDELNDTENHANSRGVIDEISQRYDVSRVMVQKTIAEWEAGKKPTKK